MILKLQDSTILNAKTFFPKYFYQAVIENSFKNEKFDKKNLHEI